MNPNDRKKNRALKTNPRPIHNPPRQIKTQPCSSEPILGSSYEDTDDHFSRMHQSSTNSDLDYLIGEIRLSPMRKSPKNNQPPPEISLLGASLNAPLTSGRSNSTLNSNSSTASLKHGHHNKNNDIAETQITTSLRIKQKANMKKKQKRVSLLKKMARSLKRAQHEGLVVRNISPKIGVVNPRTVDFRHGDSFNSNSSTEIIDYPNDINDTSEVNRCKIKLLIDQCETNQYEKKRLNLSNMNLCAKDFPVDYLCNNNVLSKSLHKLSLAGNCLITVPDKLVTGLSLRKLDLSQCNLRKIPNLWSLPHLEVLKLSHNKLEDFPDEVSLFKDDAYIYW